MANGKISRSWTFFGTNPSNMEYLHEDYQPQQMHHTNPTRVDLRQRFQNKNVNTFQQVEEPQYENIQAYRQREVDYDEVYEEPQKFQRVPLGQQKQYRQFYTQSYGAMPRRSMRRLPSSIAPLWNNIQDNLSNLKADPGKIMHESGTKINKVFQTVRTSILSVSQKFRRTTRRRYKLDDSDCDSPSRTPQLTRRVTPGKLYSPFNVNTPKTPHSIHTKKQPKRLQNTTPKRLYDNEARGPQTPPVQLFTSQLSNRKKRFVSPRSQMKQNSIDNYMWNAASASPKPPMSERLDFNKRVNRF